MIFYLIFFARHAQTRNNRKTKNDSNRGTKLVSRIQRTTDL